MKSPRLEALRAALEKAEFRLAATQDLARVGDWELDRHTGRMHWSRELFRLFERPEALGVPDLNEALGYFSLDSTNRTRDLFWEAIDTGRRCALEQEVLLPSGEERRHFTVIVPVADETGRVFRLYGTVQDITERRRLESERLEHLERLEELSRHLVEIEERERRELASALHDRASPNLAALRILFSSLAEALPDPPAANLRRCWRTPRPCSPTPPPASARSARTCARPRSTTPACCPRCANTSPSSAPAPGWTCASTPSPAAPRRRSRGRRRRYASASCRRR